MTRQDLIQRLTAIIDGQSVLRESLPMPPDQCRDAIHQQLQLLRALRSDVESQGIEPPRVTAFDKVNPAVFVGQGTADDPLRTADEPVTAPTEKPAKRARKAKT